MIDLWYSADQRASVGRYVVYRSTDGREVVCTQVGPVSGSGWTDYENVGQAEDHHAFVREVWEDPFKEAMMREQDRLNDAPFRVRP